MNLANIKPLWIDRNLYPFQSKYLRLDAGNMHYIDEGVGETFLFVHGTPTWSFLYRDLIKELSNNYRCIAVDHMGFGLSKCDNSFSGTPEAHSENLGEFIIKLNLENITMVVHDFGGPIGLGAAIANSERIGNIVLFNTWLWKTIEEKDALKIDRILNSRLGKFLYLNMNFSPKVLLKKGFVNKSRLTKNVHKHYIKPFPDKQSRMPLLQLGRSLIGSSGWYECLWEELYKLDSTDWLILWGVKDQFITTEYLDKWKSRLPHARVREFECGHFVQEEETVESIKTIHSFMKSKSQKKNEVKELVISS